MVLPMRAGAARASEEQAELPRVMLRLAMRDPHAGRIRNVQGATEFWACDVHTRGSWDHGCRALRNARMRPPGTGIMALGLRLIGVDQRVISPAPR